jgi:hypothetical protein
MAKWSLAHHLGRCTYIALAYFLLVPTEIFSLSTGKAVFGRKEKATHRNINKETQFLYTVQELVSKNKGKS